MKKIILLFACVLSIATISAQEDTIAVFVYSPTKLNEPINALRSNIEEALVNSASKKYIVLDRTEEFQTVLGKEIDYQEKGYVSNKQLITVGGELGAKKVCGVVITDYGEEGYFIECKILDIAKKTIDCTAKYPVKKGDRIKNLGIANSEVIASSIAAQLDLLSIDQKDEQIQEEKRKEEERIRKEKRKEEERIQEEKRKEEERIQEEKRKEEERIRKEKREKEEAKERKRREKEYERANNPYFLENRNKYIAWAFLGGGYPWNLVSSIEFRTGGIIGVGLYGDVGADFMRIIVNDGNDNFAYTTKTMFRYAGGVKFYMYKGLFLDIGYGTISQPTDEVTYDFYLLLSDDESTLVKKMASESSHGLLFHLGYNFVENLSKEAKGVFIGINGGVTYDITNKEFAPSINLKIGYAWKSK